MFDVVQNISCFAVVLRSFSQDCLIYAKLIIEFIPDLEFSPYLEVIHGIVTFKLKMITIQLEVFDLSFIFFIAMSQTISFTNRSGACYFLHASN